MNQLGPDAEGFFENKNKFVLLGHKRLFIMIYHPSATILFKMADIRYRL